MPAPHATHPTPEQLAAFAAGRLGDAPARAVAAHLKDCPACRRAAARTGGSTAAPHATAAPGPSPEPPADLPPELRSHPRYRVLRKLGRGGMGVVYQAEQTLMHRPVAIKLVASSFLDQPGAAERFLREVQSAAKLSHPNIVIAYDAEQVGGAYMLVMEYVEGQSLDQVLRRKGPLPVAHACHYTRQAALGLQHALERHMVHRDIKPQNLMLTPDGQVKVLDFGLAKVVRETGGTKPSLTAANAYMGTPDYCAPEQAADARTADIRADIYSLGCTLYALLAGAPPFREDTAILTILAHVGKEPRPLPEVRPDVPAELWAVIARMLAKAPAERYQTPAEVAQALAPFCKKGAAAVVQPSLPVPSEAAQQTAVPHETGRLPSIPKLAVATEAGAAGGLPLAELVEAMPSAPKAPLRRAAGWGWLPWLVGGGAAAALLLGAGVWLAAGVLLRPKPSAGPVVVDPDVVAGADRSRPDKADLSSQEPAVPAAAPRPEGNVPEPQEPPPQPAAPAPDAQPPQPEPVPKPEPPSPPKEEPPPPAPQPEPTPPPEPENEPTPPPKGAARPARPKPAAPSPEDAEEAATRQVKEVKRLIDDAKLERLMGNVVQAEKSLRRAGERLKEISAKYPGTKGAAEAEELLDKIGP